MKRTISMLLTLAMIASCFLMIPLSAEEQSAGTAQTYYSTDFANLYTTLGLTEMKDAATVENLGVKLFANGSEQNDNSYANLTSNGLEIGSVNKMARGFTFNGYDLTKQTSYLVQMTMSFGEVATNCYPFFGFGTKDATTWDVRKDTANWTNMRFNGGSALVINGFTSSDNMAVIWSALYERHAEATYQFVVENNVLTKILIKCDGSLYSFNATGSINASGGDFSFSFRTDGSSVTKVTLKNLSVLSADQLLKDDNAGEKEVLENILTKNRTQPAEPELAYEDTASTKYNAGYVLHYMDFSKVTNFADTGYFVTNDAEPEAFMIKDGELRIKTDSSNGVKVMLTGNGIPKFIQDFTMQIKFRFVEPSSSYFVFIQSNTIGEDGKTSAQKDTCFRYNGTVDNATTLDKEADVAAFFELVRAGEEVTFTYSAMERETYRIIATCGDYTITWMKASNTVSVQDCFFGFMVGRGTNLAISSVMVVADTYDNYDALTWPAEENALVQNVSANAIYVPTVKPNPPVSGDDDKPNNNPTEDEKNPPKQPTVTDAPDTVKETTPDTEAPKTEKGGCASAVSGAWMLLAILPAAALMLLPSKKNKAE